MATTHQDASTELETQCRQCGATFDPPSEFWFCDDCYTEMEKEAEAYGEVWDDQHREFLEQQPLAFTLEELVIRGPGKVGTIEGYKQPDGKFVAHGEAMRWKEIEGDMKPDLVGYFNHGDLTLIGDLTSERNGDGEWIPQRKRIPRPGEVDRLEAKFLHGIYHKDHSVKVEPLRGYPHFNCKAFEWRRIEDP